MINNNCYYSELDEFLSTNPKSHLFQSGEWAKVKENWEHKIIVVRKDGRITGSMSILLKKMPIVNSYMMYAPRGFVCNLQDKETLEKLTIEAKKIAKEYKAFIFRLDPDIPNKDENFKSLMKSLGYKLKNNIKTINDVVQPKYVYRLNIKGKTEEEVFKSFKEKTRYNIRLSLKKNVKIREGNREDIPIFYDILKETSKRDHFFIRDIKYFEKIYDIMYPKFAKILIAEYDDKPIAVAMPIYYGNKVWYLYGGSSNEHRNLMPTYLLQWEMIKWALEKGCDIYDFGGISGYKDKNSNMYGVYRFKSGFNGEIVEFIDELYIVFNPFINTIWNIIYSLRTKILNIKNKGIKKYEDKKHQKKLFI